MSHGAMRTFTTEFKEGVVLRLEAAVTVTGYALQYLRPRVRPQQTHPQHLVVTP